MFDWLARQVTRRGWMVILAWVAIAVALRLYAPEWKSVSQDDNVRFFPPGYPSVVGQDLLEAGFPGNVASSTYVIIGERPDRQLTADDLLYLDDISTLMTRLKVEEPDLNIKSVTDRRTPIIGSRMLGRSQEGGEAALVTVALTTTFAAKRTRITVDRFEELMASLPDPPRGLNLQITGSASVGHDMNSASNESIARTTDATILLVVLILLIVYRSPVLALIPLSTIGLSVFIGLKAIACMSLVPWINFQVINITNVFVVVVLFGAGTDYCLFLIARYREELARGRSATNALTEAIRQVGGALTASAGTVVIGLGMLYFSSFAKIQYTGPAIALALAIALAAAITLAPVLLRLLGKAVFWPFKPPHHERGHEEEEESLAAAPASRLWSSIADSVVRYPGTILLLCLAVLLPLALVGSRTKSNYSQLADLHQDQPSVTGARVIKKYFAVGELGPSVVLIHHPEIDFRSDAGLRTVEDLARKIALVDNVAEVRAVSRPLGKPLPLTSERKPPARNESFLDRMNRLRLQTQETVATTALRAGADSRYVSTNPASPSDRNHITRIEVVYRTDPFSPASMATMREVARVVEDEAKPDRLLAGATEIGLGGATAEVNDLQTVTTLDQRRMYYLVTLGVYVVLVLLLKRPGISLYLIATVVLGYLASLGITDLVFQMMHTGPEPWGGLDWKVGFFLFVILVAVGEDYNILLMARVIEEERKHGPIEGTRLAVAHTGGIISSCGLIMAGTFLSMLSGSLASLRQLGFALGIGVMLDTFIVRPVLVPAFIVLWHRLFPGRKIESVVAHRDHPISTNGSLEPGRTAEASGVN